MSLSREEREILVIALANRGIAEAIADAIDFSVPEADPHSLHINGNNSPTANISWGGFQITNVGDILFSGLAQRFLKMPDNAVADASSVEQLNIKGGDKTAGTGTGGNVSVLGGLSVGGNGGGITLDAGDTQAVSGTAGNVLITGGSTFVISDTSVAGSVIIAGGSSRRPTLEGVEARIVAGQNIGGGAGGQLNLWGGNSTTSGTGGTAILKGGRSTGGGTAGNVQLVTGNTLLGFVRLTADAFGNVVMGTAALATNATDGFFYLNSSAGAPTGVPTAKSGRIAMHYDSTNDKLYAYNGAWIALN